MRSTIVPVVCALAVSGFALAQEPADRVFYRAEVGPVPHAVAQDMVVSTFGGKAVTGKPYSAEGVTEFTQKLADGTTISRKNSSTVYRDSQGRTRREQTINVIGPWVPEGEAPKMITIFDPVSGETISLNPRDKTARKIEMLGTIVRDMPPPHAAPSGVGVVGGTISHSAGAGVVSHSADAPKRVMHFEKRMDVEGPVTAGAMIAGRAAEFGGAHFDVMVHRSPGDSKTDDLGTQTIEGVVAEGTKTTMTIPTGAIGNDRPITTVSTRWYSRDLDTVVLSETDDPLAGRTVYRLTNLRRDEPAASLFQIPADYTLKEEKDLPHKIMMHREAKQK